MLEMPEIEKIIKSEATASKLIRFSECKVEFDL